MANECNHPNQDIFESYHQKHGHILPVIGIGLLVVKMMIVFVLLR